MKKCFLSIACACLLCALLPGCQTNNTDAAQAPVPAAASSIEHTAEPDNALPLSDDTMPATDAHPLAEEESVTRLILFDTACKKLETSEQLRYEKSVTAYAIRDLIAEYELEAADEVTVIGANGYRETEPYEGFLEKYISLTAEYAPIIVGEAQDADWAIHCVAAIRIGATAIVFFYQTADIAIADLFTLADMTEAEAYTFVCEDGYRQTVSETEIPSCTLSRIDGRYDAKIPSLGEYTLYNVLSMIPEA